MDFRIELEDRPLGVRLLRVHGPIVRETLPAFEQGMLDALNGAPAAVLLDFSGVAYLSSSGVGLIMQGYAQALEDGARLIVFGAKPAEVAVMNLTGLASMVTLAATEQDALDLLR